jgi:hypothetical protein
LGVTVLQFCSGYTTQQLTVVEKNRSGKTTTGAVTLVRFVPSKVNTGPLLAEKDFGVSSGGWRLARVHVWNGSSRPGTTFLSPGLILRWWEPQVGLGGEASTAERNVADTSKMQN